MIETLSVWCIPFVSGLWKRSINFKNSILLVYLFIFTYELWNLLPVTGKFSVDVVNLTLDGVLSFQDSTGLINNLYKWTVYI